LLRIIEGNEYYTVKKENEGLGELFSALFLLFTLFIHFLWSLSHSINLKVTIGFNLYLKFAKG